jgi:hypothetical protein
VRDGAAGWQEPNGSFVNERTHAAKRITARQRCRIFDFSVDLRRRPEP